MKPILFNTEMVKAILDGRKTVTRRIVKDRRGYTPGHYGRHYFYKQVENLNNYQGPFAGFYKDSDIFYMGEEKHIDAIYFRQPYKVGDILYIRETWGVENIYGNGGTFGFDAVYKADNKIIPVIIKDWDRYVEIGKFFDKKGWQPSLFMPKEAARIFLKVTGIRVERLQKMESENDSNYKSEGAKDKHDFIQIWDTTVKKSDIDRYGWYANPWVWVIEFERVDNPELLQEVD